MSVLVIGDAEKQAIAKLVEHAAANPVPWELTKDVATSSEVTELTLADRKNAGQVTRPPSEHIMLGNVTVAYSHEEQPSGIFRHISASVGTAGRLPTPLAVGVICEAFGFSDTLCEAVARGGRGPRMPPASHLWLEEFEPGHQAVNIIEMIKKHSVQ